LAIDPVTYTLTLCPSFQWKWMSSLINYRVLFEHGIRTRVSLSSWLSWS